MMYPENREQYAANEPSFNARPPMQAPMQPPMQPVYGNGTPSVAGMTNAYPMYMYQRTPQDIEREKIRGASNAGGKLTISIFITMVVVAVTVIIIGFFSGIMLGTPTEGDPYMGFTPMGFYLYEGLTSLVSIFIPSMIILSSVKKNEKLRTENIIPFSKIGGKKLALIVLGGMSFCMVAQIMSFLLSINFGIFGFDINEAVDTTYGTSPVDIMMNSICIALIPALVEEFAYRGVVLGALKKYDTSLAIIGSAYLFGMLHGNLAQIPFAFTLGLMLAYVRVKTDSMLPNILIHFGNNFYAVLITIASEVLDESVSTFVDVILMIVFMIIGLICIYFLAKKYKEFFDLKAETSYLTFSEKLKTFFSSGTVIASTIILCIESLAVIKMID